MKNKERVCGLIGLATRAGKIVFGTEACKKDLEKNKIKLLIIATDASERTKMDFKSICNNKNVTVKEYLNVEEISKAIGKANKAVIGIKDLNFATEVEKIINGGEAIG